VASNRELEAFSYSVSHDLRTPLRAIDGFSQSILEEYGDKLDEQGKADLQRVRAAAKRMGILIDDLLTLARTARSEMSHQRVELSNVAQEIVSQLKATNPERQTAFTIAPGLTVDGDPGLLRVVLENLLGNAWKFTSHKPQAAVELGVEQRDGERIYFVRDNGVGFDMQYADKLFAPFQRLHSDSEFPGTGVGLATVQRIIRRHGGRIWVNAAVDQGATFYFVL
jgi:light-regulated signal transduction histidine kinase (bacteriophytochrome)